MDVEWQRKHYVSHFALRTLNPENCGEFYCKSLRLTMSDRAETDQKYFLSDGRITLVVTPWDIAAYAAQEYQELARIT